MNRLISKVPFRIIAVITVAISLATTVSAASLKWNETEAHGTDPREMKFAQWVKAPQPVPAEQQEQCSKEEGARLILDFLRRRSFI